MTKFSTGEDQQEPKPRILQAGPATVCIFQIYNDNLGLQYVIPEFNPLKYTPSSPFHESGAIISLLREQAHELADYFGVFSWKFKLRVLIDTGEFLSQIAKGAATTDVYSFFTFKDRPVWALPIPDYPDLLIVAQILFDRLGISLDLKSLNTPFLWQNHFVARAKVLTQFREELLEPAVACMLDETDRELQRILHPGNDSLSYHSFIAARLFSTWLAMRSNIRVGRIIPPDWQEGVFSDWLG